MNRISLFICLLVGTIANAQNDFKGTITSSFKYENLTEQMAAMKSMLPSSSKTEVGDGMAKTVTPNGMGGETVVISNTKTGDILMLQNMMGNKFAVEMKGDEMKKKQEEAGLEIEYTEETKEIMGYKCKKAVVIADGNKSEIYYTEELPAVSLNGQPNGVKGFPMQTIITTEMFTMISTVTEIKEGKVSKIVMEAPEGYKVMTQEELKKMMGGGM